MRLRMAVFVGAVLGAVAQLGSGAGFPCVRSGYPLYKSIEDEVAYYLLLRHGPSREHRDHILLDHGAEIVPILEKFAMCGSYNQVSGGLLQANALYTLSSIQAGKALDIAEAILLKGLYWGNPKNSALGDAVDIMATAPRDRALRVLDEALERYQNNLAMFSSLLRALENIGGLSERDLMRRLAKGHSNPAASRWADGSAEAIEVRLELRPAPPRKPEWNQLPPGVTDRLERVPGMDERR